MRFFELSIYGWFLRLILMMAVVIIGGFTGQWWIGLLALPIFLSALLGVALK